MIRHLHPAACGQTYIRPVQVRQKRAVLAWVPPENIQRTGDIIGLGSVYERTECPRCRIAIIESEHRTDFVIDFELVKLRSLFRPFHIPAYAADEIAFMTAIPYGGSNFHEQEPAESRGYVRDWNWQLPNADCRVPILNSDLRPPISGL